MRLNEFKNRDGVARRGVDGPQRPTRAQTETMSRAFPRSTFSRLRRCREAVRCAAGNLDTGVRCWCSRRTFRALARRCGRRSAQRHRANGGILFRREQKAVADVDRRGGSLVRSTAIDSVTAPYPSSDDWSGRYWLPRSRLPPRR